MTQAINIVFDGPPEHKAGRFVEVETDDGKSINIGEWIKRSDGFWVLRIKVTDILTELSFIEMELKSCKNSR